MAPPRISEKFAVKASIRELYGLDLLGRSPLSELLRNEAGLRCRDCPATGREIPELVLSVSAVVVSRLLPSAATACTSAPRMGTLLPSQGRAHESSEVASDGLGAPRLVEPRSQTGEPRRTEKGHTTTRLIAGEADISLHTTNLICGMRIYGGKRARVLTSSFGEPALRGASFAVCLL